jgi:hypothetical protein
MGLEPLVAKAHALDGWTIQSAAGERIGGANLGQLAGECGFPTVTMQSSELGAYAFALHLV